MEFLNMMGSQGVRLWLAQATVLFFLMGGVVLLGIGVSLLVNSARALRFFGSMNRWVSMRSASRPLEIPRDTRQAVQQYRYWLAAVFVAGGVFAVFSLLTQFKAAAVVNLFGLDFMRPAVAGWLVDSLRWMLIAGNLAAVVAGIMLAFFPDAVVALEARGSHWYSERKITKGADDMNTRLDAWVTVYPRAAGGIIVVFALALIGAFGLILPKVW
ncbi:MAG: hypothetical protein K2X06_11445 [Burkholderiales bacterium]|nr:hypothetical protein [Burkholderiales bacterium]